jgi:Rrf2 family protein
VLTHTSKYALRAMGYIAKFGDEKPVLSRMIAEEMDIPQNFLSKIMHRLVQASYLTSARGMNGGFKLMRESETITLFEVVALFMNIQELSECLLGQCECNGTCALHGRVEPVITDFIEVLKGTTIDKVL